jgi:hypothetical protein
MKAAPCVGDIRFSDRWIPEKPNNGQRYANLADPHLSLGYSFGAPGGFFPGSSYTLSLLWWGLEKPGVAYS